MFNGSAKVLKAIILSCLMDLLKHEGDYPIMFNGSAKALKETILSCLMNLLKH